MLSLGYRFWILSAALLFSVSPSAGAQTPTAANLFESSWSAREVFAQNYLAATGRVLGTEFVGLSSQIDATSGEQIVRVWVADSASSIVGQELRCSPACVLGGGLPSQAYSHSQRRLSDQLLLETLLAAEDEFTSKIAALEQLVSLKLWVRGAYAYYRMEWQKPGVGLQTSFMACHQHGSHVDCHRQTRAGAGEF